MSDAKSSRPRRPLQKPVFIIQDFDPSNPEHMKGNVPVILNKALALELVKFIRDSELGPNEGHIYAMQGRLGRWYKNRIEHIRKLKAEEAKNTLPDEIHDEIHEDSHEG